MEAPQDARHFGVLASHAEGHPLLRGGRDARRRRPGPGRGHNATLGATAPSFAWNGGPGNGTAVSTPAGGISIYGELGCRDGLSDCEDILCKIQDAGKLPVSVNADDDSTDAIDVYLYESNEAGEIDEDAELTDAQGATEKSDETLSWQVKPGYYLARVSFYDAQEDTYKGTAELTGFAVPAQPAQPPQPAQPAQPDQPAQPAAKKKSRKAACQKKARKIRNKGKRKKALKRCAKLKR